MSAAPRGAPGRTKKDGCRRQALRRPQPCATRPRSGGVGRPRPGRTTPASTASGDDPPVSSQLRGETPGGRTDVEVRVHGAPAGTPSAFHGAPKSLSGCRSPPPDWRAFSRVILSQTPPITAPLRRPNNQNTTLNGGSLGSWVDEDRS